MDGKMEAREVQKWCRMQWHSSSTRKERKKKKVNGLFSPAHDLPTSYQEY